MDLNTLRNRIKLYVKKIYKEKYESKEDPSGYNKLSKFEELQKILTSLLTDDFNFFLKGIDWVAPRPTTFRIRLKNGADFYLIYNENTWVAQIEGKKYYLLGVDEEEKAVNSISKLLRYKYTEQEEKGES